LEIETAEEINKSQDAENSCSEKSEECLLFLYSWLAIK
jgi:hypothetical protein